MVEETNNELPKKPDDLNEQVPRDLNQQMPSDLNQQVPKIILRLYITGASPNSVKAVTNTRVFCNTYFSGRYDLEIIDVYQQPELAQREQIIALPLLVCKMPLPEKRLIGDMSDFVRALKYLDL